ncbi:MAG: hypothetical protein QXR58_02055 [Candidatus Micrarchaeaceae archaeon]
MPFKSKIKGQVENPAENNKDPGDLDKVQKADESLKLIKTGKLLRTFCVELMDLKHSDSEADIKTPVNKIIDGTAKIVSGIAEVLEREFLYQRRKTDNSKELQELSDRIYEISTKLEDNNNKELLRSTNPTHQTQ